MSAGKDRRIILWKKDESKLKYGLMHCVESAHKRIIWSVQFSKTNMLASGSRDGFVKIWTITNDKLQEKYKVELKVSVTALSFAPRGNNILGIGLEDGSIEIWDVSSKLKCLHRIPQMDGHTKTVTKLSWNDCDKLVLASGSHDYGIRVHEIDMDDSV